MDVVAKKLDFVGKECYDALEYGFWKWSMIVRSGHFWQDLQKTPSKIHPKIGRDQPENKLSHRGTILFFFPWPHDAMATTMRVDEIQHCKKVLEVSVMSCRCFTQIIIHMDNVFLFQQGQQWHQCLGTNVACHRDLCLYRSCQGTSRQIPSNGQTTMASQWLPRKAEEDADQRTPDVCTKPGGSGDH